MTAYEYTSEELQKFWSKVAIPLDKTQCWEWQAYCLPGGYGTMRWDGKKRLAHRVSWMIAHGVIPDGLCICHICDNRKCVNPDHLFIGAHTDNMQDRNGKNRQAKQKGELHGGHKLTYAQVNEIRIRYAAGGITQRVLGLDYGVCQQVVWGIVRHKSWA